jgi:transcription elongation factor GreA
LGVSDRAAKIAAAAFNVSAEPMEKIPMTRAGFAALMDELKQLKSVERPAIIAAIAEARSLGDLSENAEYHSAREKQSFIEGRIKELEATVSLAEVIDPATLSGPIKFGATVKLVDEDTDEERTFQIVGEPEADLERGLLNIRSPLARALIGREPGDSIEVRTPGGEKSYEVLSVAYV